MATYRDQGIVLRTYKLGETDRIVHPAHPGTWQGPSGRQGRPASRVEVRWSARAVRPRRPAAVRGPLARHHQPGRAPRCPRGDPRRLRDDRPARRCMVELTSMRSRRRASATTGSSCCSDRASRRSTHEPDEPADVRRRVPAPAGRHRGLPRLHGRLRGVPDRRAARLPQRQGRRHVVLRAVRPPGPAPSTPRSSTRSGCWSRRGSGRRSPASRAQRPQAQPDGPPPTHEPSWSTTSTAG
jgi:hypothetical protein